MNAPTIPTGEAAPEAGSWHAPMEGLRLARRDEGPVSAIQLFGQRCSGTNVLAKLVRANFGEAALTDRYGFKHWFVPEQTLFPPSVLALVVAREPRGWVRSLHRQPWHAHPDLKRLAFSDFIRAEWHAYWDGEFAGITERHPLHGREMLHERDPLSGLRFANPLRKRTAKLGHWSALAARAPQVALLDHDVLHRDPRALLAALGRLLGREPSWDLGPAETYKGNGFRRFEPRRDPPLDEADDAFIRSQLDPVVEARFGFAA